MLVLLKKVMNNKQTKASRSVRGFIAWAPCDSQDEEAADSMRRRAVAELSGFRLYVL